MLELGGIGRNSLCHKNHGKSDQITMHAHIFESLANKIRSNSQGTPVLQSQQMLLLCWC